MSRWTRAPRSSWAEDDSGRRCKAVAGLYGILLLDCRWQFSCAALRSCVLAMWSSRRLSAWRPSPLHRRCSQTQSWIGWAVEPPETPTPQIALIRHEGRTWPQQRCRRKRAGRRRWGACLATGVDPPGSRVSPKHERRGRVRMGAQIRVHSGQITLSRHGMSSRMGGENILAPLPCDATRSSAREPLCKSFVIP